MSTTVAEPRSATTPAHARRQMSHRQILEAMTGLWPRCSRRC